MPSDLSHSQSERLARLLELGGQLSAEQNVDALLERILDAAKNLTGAEGGTLYQLENDALRFMLVRNDRLDLHLGGQASEAVPFPPLALHHPNGSPNLEQVASHVALTARVINIADAYCTDDYDFSGTRRFDAQTGYRSRSFLTVPLTLPNGEVLGVLQLINALDDSGQVHAFDADDQALVVALAALAASALANRSLIAQLEQLMEGLIGMINLAIDEKSSHTGQHCMRVPVLVKLLAEAVHHCDEGVLADFRLDDAERYQLHIAGMVHDCGKLVTPDHIVNKSTKLEAIHDRIHAVAPRFTALARETERNYAERRLRATDERERLALDAALAGELAVLRDDLGFLRQVNQGGEYMSETLQARVRAIGRHTWHDLDGTPQPLLSQDEIDNLCISRGTLNAAERSTINHHIVATEKMLSALPWPKHLNKVVEYAVNHHERVDGKGYPKGLTGEEMSLPARMMAIADVFEALTARDRPYKPPRTVSESLAILESMMGSGHLDPDLGRVFIDDKVWLQYAERYLEPEQLDVEQPTVAQPGVVRFGSLLPPEPSASQPHNRPVC